MAGNTRFHNKYHYAQHHSEVTDKNTVYPDAATDPIASEGLPFQGDFYADGVIKVRDANIAKFHLLGNNTTVDGILTVTSDLSAAGNLYVDGNVFLRANPLGNDRVIEIGDAIGTDRVRFKSFIDSDLIPARTNMDENPDRDGDDEEDYWHDIGAPDQRWHWLFMENLDMDGMLRVGTCDPDRGMYINPKENIGSGARLGINNCEPAEELDVVGDVTISETLNVDSDARVKGNYTLDGWMDIGGIIDMKFDNALYWNDLTTSIKGTAVDLSLQHSAEIGLYTNKTKLKSHSGNFNIDATGQPVDVDTEQVVDAFSIDGCTFSLDAQNDRVGINTCAPEVELHVVGSGKLDGKSLDIDVTDDVDIVAGKDFDLEAGIDIGMTSKAGNVSLRAENNNNDGKGVMNFTGRQFEAFAEDEMLWQADSITETAVTFKLDTTNSHIKATDTVHIESA